MRDLDLLVAGDCNPDLVLAGGDVRPVFDQSERLVDTAELVVGGTSSITACGAARLGLRTAFAGVIGDDLWGRFMRDALQTAGVDTSPLHVSAELPTGLSVVLVNGTDRATLTHQGAIGALATEHVDDALLARVRHVHTAGYYLQGASAVIGELFARARAAGATTSLDPGADPTERWGEGLRELLAEVDQFLPNEVEACGLAGTDDVEQAARELAALGPEVLVKCGAAGVLAAHGQTVVRVPAPAAEVVDTIGAGDSTNAGWLAGRLAGWDIERSARLAVVCGTLSTRARGGTAGQPTMAEATAAL